MTNELNTVLYCRFCGNLNPEGSGLRCSQCGAYSGMETVVEEEARRRSRRVRLDFLRSRITRIAIVVVPLLMLLVWVLWGYTGLPPDPPLPTTNIGTTNVGDTSVAPVPGDWPQARGGITNTAASVGDLDVTAEGVSDVAWRYVAGAPIVAAPAVVGGRVYVTAEDGTVTALDESSGAMVWQYESGLTATVTPAVVNDLVFVVFRPGVVSALNAHTGDVVWSRRLQAASLPSPTVADGRLFVAETDQNRLLALDAATGADLWDYHLSDWVIAPPAVIDGKVIATSNDAVIHIVDEATGQRRMIFDAGQGRWVRGAPIVTDRLLHVSTNGGRVWGIDYQGHRYPLERQWLYVRTVVWVWGFTNLGPIQQGSVWAVRTAGEQPYSPTLAGATAVIADTTGIVTGLDTDAGRILWETDLADDINVAPTIAGEVALIALESGEVVGLSAADGSRAWSAWMAGLVTASPIIAGDRLLVATAEAGGTLVSVARVAK